METLFESPHFSIHNESGTKIPDIPFAEIKEKILGKDYDLVLVFASKKRAEDLHREWKNESGPANILSFPLSKKEGEIYIHPNQKDKKYLDYAPTFSDYIGFLFIHGLLHLKGMEHGSTMEASEQKFCSLFNIRQAP